MILFRPTGLSELKLVAALGWTGWPPRLPDQPIFYPVLSLEYARRIAREWNARDHFSGFAGFVTTFRLEHEFSRRYPVQLAGGRSHEELWVPSSELAEFNAHIVDSITVVEAYPGASYTGLIDPETRVPSDLADGYRARPRTTVALTVRRAESRDADESVALVIASITTLCAADHLNDPATLERWLLNKTAVNFRRWLADPATFIVVAEVDRQLCGIAALHSSGTVQLCYVLPGMQRYGVGRALIGALEAEALRLGVNQLVLTSTKNARRFYENQGFVASGTATIAFGVLEQYPYVKSLLPCRPLLGEGSS